MKKYRNGIFISLAFIFSMVISYAIGQYVPKLFEEEQTQTIDISNLADKYVFVDNYEEIEKYGCKDTKDNPWGSTVANIVSDEIIGNGILITPETGISVNVKTPDNGVLYFSYNLYESVARESDGAILNLTIVDMNNTEIINENYNVVMSDEFIERTIDLSEYVDKDVKITFTCTNADKNNSNCDWVILKNAKVLGGHKETVTVEEEYVKAVHYFSDEWPINFWNSEMDDLDEDMNQIQKDGFDSIILVIPWREFQPTTSPISYNDYAFEKLDEIITTADKYDLKVFTRIGYTWDFYEDENDVITNHFYQLMGDADIRAAWLDYVDTMYKALAQYNNFAGGFLTWEDFWNNISVCDSVGGNKEDTVTAQYIGYQDFVKQNYTLEEYNETYGEEIESYEDIYIPSREQPAMKAFYDFYDDFLNNILEASQKVFPNLSLEVRVDWDVTYDKNGMEQYSKHETTFLCGDSDFTSVMYGIPMGFENNGERVSYKDALEKTNSILGSLYDATNGKKIFVEQFIFADNTPAFSQNAQIKSDEVNDYLKNVSEVLLDKTWGYGIWTYRDYRANMIYNSQFALDTLGWNCTDGVSIVEKKDSNMIAIPDGGKISQIIPGVRNHFISDEYVFTCDVIPVGKSTVTVNVGNQSQSIELGEASTIELKFASDENYNIEIISSGETIIDNVRLYSQIQSGLLYDEEGKELECISGIRKLNEKLNKKVSYEKVIEDETVDQDMNEVESFKEDETVNKDINETKIFKLDNTNNWPDDVNIEIIENTNEIVLDVTDGQWDCSDVLNPSVIQYNGKLYNYYSGYDGDTWRTGVATSEDGITWTKEKDNPVLDISNEGWDSQYIAANGSAIVINNKVYYYYHGVDKKTGKASIGLAISEDGINFEKCENALITPGESNTWNSVSVADPYVIEYDNKLYMYYLGENELGIQRLGVAVSIDGINWTENKLNPIMDVGVKGAFDENGLGEPSVIYQAPYFYMLYTGRNAKEQRNIGLAVSSDGVNWKKMNYQGIFELEVDKWNSQVMCDTTMIYDETNNNIKVWYGGGNIASPDENLNGKIGMFKIKTNVNPDISEVNFSTNKDYTKWIKGCYTVENSDNKSYVWASDSVKILLANDDAAENIVFNGNVDLNLLKYAGDEEFRLEFYINNVQIKEEVITESGEFEIDIPKNGYKGENFEIKVRSNKSVIPKEYNLSEDIRNMSYQIYSVSQKREVF